MIQYIIAVLLATGAWFFVAAVLFFNPIVDKIYQSEESHPSVRSLPKSPSSIAKIIFAIVMQCILWALVYFWVQAALPATLVSRVLIFGSIIGFVKIIPRDIDRVLLTTYPSKRMLIEFVVGFVCAYVVAFIFVWRL